jgi:WD40 repeat protein
MAERARTFRVFVSSTFRDLDAERNVLLERVFRPLKELCRSEGHRFQDIDLRWGISEEASLNQQAVKICLGEIARCREVTPRPNFIVLLGNRYGWLPPPAQLLAQDFERIQDKLSTSDQELLAAWYMKDENAVPLEYFLRPREKDGPYQRYEEWEPVERALHLLLAQGVKGSHLEADPRFRASATEQEILAAADNSRTWGQAFAFVRDIELKEGDPDPKEAAVRLWSAAERVKGATGKQRERALKEKEAVEKATPILAFMDPLEASVNQRDESPLGRLKAKLENEFIVKHYKAQWDSERERPTTDHLDDLARDVREVLERAIIDEINNPSPLAQRSEQRDHIQADSALDADGRGHRTFAVERCRIFVGRKDSLTAVATYLNDSDPRPMVVSGQGGIGKSALLAQSLRRAQRDHPESEILYRFIGATPESSNGRSVLAGMCRELARRGYGRDESSVPADYLELCSDFAERLADAGSVRPLALFLDSVDQLIVDQAVEQLTWLPTSLPDDVRMIVSTRPGDALDILARRGARVKELGAMEPAEGDELLRRWLEEAHRTLQPAQRREVLAKFDTSEGNPLYLRLAFEEARRWRSGQSPTGLATGVEGIIAESTYGRLAEHHGDILVSRALAYLAAARHGLSEDELLDVLSRDPDVYEWFLCEAHHMPFDLSKSAGEAGVSERLDGWLTELRTGGTGTSPELRSFLQRVLPSRFGPRVPVILWSRLASDLHPYLTEQVRADASLITFYHRELWNVARQRYLERHESHYHGRLADYFRPETDEDTRRNWEGATVHGLSELPYHLIEAGEERREELHAILTDFDFLEAKVGRISYDAARDDFRAAPGLSSKVARELIRALDLEAHNLRQWSRAAVPGFFAQQMSARALGIGSVAVLDLMRSARISPHRPASGRPRLILLFRTESPSSSLVRTFPGHTGAVSGLALTDDGRLISGSADGSIRVWDLATGYLLSSTSTGPVRAVATTVDGRAVFGLRDGTVGVWDLKDGQAARKLGVAAGMVLTLAATQDGFVISGGSSRTVDIWDIESGREIRRLEREPPPLTTGPYRTDVPEGGWGAVASIVLTPSGLCVAGFTDAGAAVWDLHSGEQVQYVSVHDTPITCVAATPDGRHAVSAQRALRAAERSSKVFLWELDGDGSHEIGNHNDSIVGLFARGAEVTAASESGQVAVWSLSSSGEKTHPGDRATATHDPVKGMHVVHPDRLSAFIAAPEQQVASASWDGVVKLWVL